MDHAPAQRLAIRGSLDGIALYFGGERLAVFPTWDAAVAAFREAQAAPAKLAAVLAV